MVEGVSDEEILKKRFWLREEFSLSGGRRFSGCQGTFSEEQWWCITGEVM